MLRQGLLSALAVHAVHVGHVRGGEHIGSKLSTRSIEAIAPAAPLEVSQNFVKLKQTSIRSDSSAALRHHIFAKGSAVSLQRVGGGIGYGTTVGFGGSDEMLLTIDTGSSDTWVVREGFTCIGAWGGPAPEEECMFGPLYSGNFSEGSIDDQKFQVSYGDGEFVIGKLGYSDITIGNVTVDHQEFALVDHAFWQGDSETSGLAGFAYPSITSAFEGSNAKWDNPGPKSVPYSPFVTSAMSQGLFTSFSLALERGDNGVGGYLAFGGLPPVSFNHTFASTSIELTELSSGSESSKNYSFYSIQPDGFSMSGRNGLRFNKKTKFPVIVDSGTTLIYLPVPIAMAVSGLYDPPAQYVEEAGNFEVECNAKAPSFAVQINGTKFYINGKDLILQGDMGEDPQTGKCVTAIQPVESEPYILGDAFLKSVIAVFDVGAGQMRFAPHTDY